MKNMATIDAIRILQAHAALTPRGPESTTLNRAAGKLLAYLPPMERDSF